MRHALSVLGEDTSRQVHHVYWRDFVVAFAEVRVPAYRMASFLKLSLRHI
jgi:hypothetical protein